MKRLSLIISLLVFLLHPSIGQQMNVASFRLLESDLDAKQNYPERDQNGNLCAIIKVVTTQTGFAFDNGTLGITKTKQQLGEIWVYVPFGTKRLTIQHASLGIIRDYLIPEKVEQGRSYELVLTTGRVITQVMDEGPTQQWLIINSIPEGATVYINEELVGITPFNKKMDAGIYTYRLELANYQNYAGKAEVTLKQKVTLDIAMKSTQGYAYITTSPEPGAKISIDSKPLTGTSPTYSMPLSAGQHTILVIKPLYKPVNKIVTITEGDTLNVDITMPVNYAMVQITSPTTTDILVDGVQKGTGLWQGRIDPGMHTFEAKKDKYVSDKQTLTLEAGQEYPINLNPIARTGSIDIITSPMKARIRINGSLTDSEGQSYGETPNTIPKLLIGEYTVSLEKEGFGALIKTVNVNEGQTVEIDEILPKGTVVTLITQPAGAIVSVNGTARGTSPVSVTLDYGNYSISASKEGYQTYSGTFTVEQGKTEYNFSLSAVGEKISISSYPSGAAVTIDGKYAGTTPLNDYMLAFGSHDVKLSLDGYNDLQKNIVLQSGKYNDSYYNYTLYASTSYKNNDNESGEERGYKAMRKATREYYKHTGGTAFMYGYHQTEFQNKGFSTLLANGDLEIAYGQAFTMKFFSGYPFFFDMTWFSSRYTPTNPNSVMESALDTISIMHHGFEVSMGFALFNLTQHFVVYAGAGYQFSRFAVGRTFADYIDVASDNTDATWDDYILAAKATNCVIAKAGASLNFGHLQFFTEVKRSISNNETKNQQVYMGVALAF